MKNTTALHYFFVWGRHPDLAAVEVLATLKRWNISAKLIDASIEAGIINVHEHLPEEFIEQLGGTIKFGLVSERLIKTETREKVCDKLTEKLVHTRKGKIFFGISQYKTHNLSKTLPVSDIKHIGKHVKDNVKEHTTVRWVTSKEKTLSSVVVKKNKLIEQGAEFVLLHGKHTFWIGHTIAVQPFEEYSLRDYGRIAVDPISGMIPPKLAHIMLNISGVGPDHIVLDPFCGSGTILQEALIMGWHHVVGADISMKAIEATKKNTEWVKKTHNVPDSTVRLFHTDVRELSSHIYKGSIDAVITEPYLGPALNHRVDKKQAVRLLEELEALYFLALIELAKILKNGSRVVVAFPVFILGTARGGLMYINNIKKLRKYGYEIHQPFAAAIKNFNLGATTSRGTYIYGRPKQKLWREIIVFHYK